MKIGIDPDSRRIAYAAFDSNIFAAVATIERANATGRILEGYDAALTSFMRRAQDRGAVLYVEDIFLARRDASNVLAYKRLAEVRGELLRAARMHAVPVVDVSASAWHSAVLGFTRDRAALKTASMEKARAVVGGKDLTEHEADAVCIALYAAKAQEAA